MTPLRTDSRVMFTSRISVEQASTTAGTRSTWATRQSRRILGREDDIVDEAHVADPDGDGEKGWAVESMHWL